ncbi:hypothetical protein V5G93_17950, partial [Escherichia albertii]|uniref:hypothetical protein n=1 Tax=Escherichia albertii TaxID=208962 RepID=UPI00378D5E84
MSDATLAASYQAYKWLPRRTDKAFTPHPATIPMSDATLAASYQAYKWLPRRTDKAFTPHP